MNALQQPLVSIQELNVSFQSGNEIFHAVKNISFDIPKGKIVAIVGESGSGKSVTSLGIMRLLPPTAKVSGKIIFNGEKDAKDLLHLPENAMRKFRGNVASMIFQEPMTSLNPVHTCGAQVMEALQTHQHISRKEALKKTILLFQQLDLPEPEKLIEKYPHQISGGQKQRVMIAMAMSTQPQLLIADEPTTALDVRVQKNILDTLKKLQLENGLSVLLITHDLAVVADYADDIIVMYKGSVVEKGTASAVLQNPAHAYTKALLACKPTPDKKGKPLPMLSNFLEGIPFESNPSPSIPVLANKVLQVKNVVVRYPAAKNFLGKTTTWFNAVNDVSFDVFENETIGLVGESGCGKTTLGRGIMQLQKIDFGKIVLNGKDLASASQSSLKETRKELQIVFQDPYGSLNPRITIGEAIMEPMMVHGISKNKREARERTAALLNRVNLPEDYISRYPHQFSGGQRQRICIARSLALNPKFLLFDESVSALDVSVQSQVLNLISELKRDYSFTSIFISHDLHVVHYISDRIMVMKKGEIVESGTADEVLFHPKNEYTKALIEAIPGCPRG